MSRIAVPGPEECPAGRHTEEVEEDPVGSHTGEELEEEAAGSLTVEGTGSAMYAASHRLAKVIITAIMTVPFRPLVERRSS